MLGVLGGDASKKAGVGENWVRAFDVCCLKLVQRPWTFAIRNRDAIDRFWDEQQQLNPAYFDGRVMLTSRVRVDSGMFHAELFETRFRNYLYWRHLGFEPDHAIDGFGSGLIRASDGAVLLVSQAPGNVNHGLFYLPSGFIDPRDVDANGAVDIAASVAREVLEEVGLGADDLVRDAGFTISSAGAHVSIAVAYRSTLTAMALESRIRKFLAKLDAPELAEIALVRRRCDLVGYKMPPHCAALLAHLLP